MSEMQCAGVRRDLQCAMCGMSKMQCVPSSRKTYPCQNKHVTVKTKAVFWDVQMLTLLNRVYKLLTEDAEDNVTAVFRIILP
jgi:hypothetical protein